MKSNFRVWFIALVGMMVFGVADAYASSGTSYSRARAFLKEGSPTAGGKVYVSTSSSTPAASSYKNCTSSTSAASSAQVEGASKKTTYHFWATANAGYKFTGWYSKNASGVYTLASSNAHFSVDVTSGAAPSSGTEYTDKDLYAEFLKLIQLSFITPTNGSYTITHNGAAVADYASFTVDGPVKLTATPAAGYKLRGWYYSTDGGTTKSYFAFGNTCEPNFTDNKTIGADFVLDDGKATFWPKGSTKVFEDLNAAVTATSSGGIIVVVSDGTLAAGDYMINKSITLLLPYSTTNAKMTEPNVVHVTAATSAPALSVYRKLSLAPGANITVASGASICLGGSIASVNGGNNSSFPCGPSGVLDLSQGGEVTLNSGATLYAWGFVQGQNMDQGNNTSGVGRIIAKSGSTVWEDYQVGDWRGGTASSSIYSSRSSWKFFPFQSWTIQNIEAPITYEYGATGKCFWTIFGDGSVHSVKFDYVASSASLFTLSAEGATLDKWYDPTTDKVVYQVDGTTKVDAITLSVLGYTITTSEYNLPVPCNMSIVLKGGTFTAANSIVMHAGSSMEVKAGASFALNTNLYLFDQSEWGKYCMYYGGSDVYFQKFNTLTKHYDRGDRTSKAGLEDATLVVDGTIVVNSSKGKLYSTASGSKIVGNGGGVIRFAGSLPSSTSIIMCTNLKNTSSVSIANANLLNENGTYTKCKGSSYFDNVNGRWFIRSAKNAKADHTWDFTYISSGAKTGTGGTDAVVSAVYSNDKTGDEDRMIWANVDDDACDDWWKGLDAGQTSYYYHYQSKAWHQFIPVSGMSGHYSGSDGKLYQKSGCDWTEPSIPYEDCLYTIDAVQKALVDGAFVQVVPNDPDDHAWHKSGAASTYYICLPGCVWKAATRIAGYSQAYTTTRDSKQYIWYEDKWLEATEDAPFFCARIDNKKKYFEFVDGAWTLMDPLAEVTISGETTEYVRFSDVMEAINDATANPTVRLLKNINLTSGVTYSNNKQVTFNLNGFTLSGEVNELITINNASAIFIVIDGSTGGTGKIDMTFAKSDDRSTAINVTAGHLMLNSGTIHAENTDSATCAINVASGQKFTMNGGRIEAVSVHNSRGVHLTSDATPIPEMVVIKGGTIDVTASADKTALAYGIYIEGGLTKVDGGTIIANAPTCKGSSYGACGIYLRTAKSRLTINGGTIRGVSRYYARSIYGYSSSSEATINGGVLEATATYSTAQAIRVNGKVTINEGAIVRANSSSSARGIYTNNANAKVWVNGGKFYVTTSGDDACGLYSQVGKDTINGGEFYVTSKGENAYGVFAHETASTVNICVADGKFMIKSKGTDSIQYAYCNNTTYNSTAVPAENISIRGGYWNINTNLSGYIGTKVVKDLDETLEADLIADGYKYKVRGAERTVTWKNYKGAVLGTTLVEDGKLPVWSGANPTYTAGDDNYVFQGWAYSAQQRAGVALTAVTADVDIYAAYINMQAELIANGTTRLYEWANSALTAAEGYEQATVRLLAYCGDNVRVHDYVPSVANAITTLDLNGHTWDCLTVQNNEDYFIKVNKSDAKLIITDNSEGKTGKLSYRRNRLGHIYGYRVASGELVLQAGTLECINTNDSNFQAIGVSVTGTSAKLTMTGGTIKVSKTAACKGGSISGIYAYGPVDIVGGRIDVNNAKSSANGIYTFNGANGTVNVGGDVTVDVIAKYDAKGTYGYGTINVDGGTFNVSTTNGSNAVAFFPCKGSGGNGSVTVDGNPTVNVSTTSGTNAYGVKVASVTQWLSNEDPSHPYDADGVTVTVNSGTFTITSGSTNASALYNHNGGEVTINGGTFNTKTSGGTCSVLEANHGSTTTINDGTFTVGTTTSGSSWWNVQGFHVYEDSGTTLVNIHGGKFTVTNSSAANSAYFIRAFAGTINLIGDSIKASANNLIYNHNEYIYNDTCFITIDGGEYTTVSTGIDAQRRVKADDATKASDMEVTILDGKFKSTSGEICNTNTTIMPVKNLKLRGGYFSKKSMSKATFDNYVVAPSTSEELTSGSEFDAGYTYHVINKHAITWDWNDGKTKSRTDQVLHNTMPDFGGIPMHTGTDTYEFLGWNTKADGSGDTVTVSKVDTTYYAQWRQLEAEVYEGDSEEPIRYEKFTDAFNAAQNMHVARIKVLSNVTEYDPWTLSPDSVGGSQPLTLDLNNHSVTCAKATTNTYALTINKEGCKLIIDDTSEQKKGSFNHSRSSKAAGMKIHGVYLQNGELELAGGTLKAMNNDTTVTSGDGAYAVVAESGTVFTQTGGKLLAQCPLDPRAYNTSGSGVFNITGGTIEVTTQYKKKSGTYYGTAAYGVYLWNYGTFNMSGTATMSVTTGSGAYGVYVYGGGGSGYPVANMSGGSITCLTETGQASRAIQVHGTHASANISGGNLTANSSEDSGRWNVEDVACTGGADVTITGGNFHSTTGANCVGVRVFYGTATIGGDAYFDSRHGVVVGDWAEVDGTTATATINGGTFNCSDYVLYANETSHDDKTVTGTMYVNGGYFKTASGKTICGTSSGVGRLVLNGGYYNETSSTTQKANITTYKGGSATVQDLASTDPAYSDGYRYHISTPYTVTWEYGDVSESETVDCGVMPSKDLTTYTYGGKIYYVTGWSPALSVVTGNITYTAVSAAYEAAVTVDETTTRYTSFSDAWAYALTQEEATITLLNNVDLSAQKTYAPTVDSARHTLDLNNFTIAYSGTGSWAIKVNRADAQLTITDNSVGAGGKLQNHVDRAGTSYAVSVVSGELVLAGGEISARNSTSEKRAHGVNVSAGGTFTMTGGTLRACSYAARAINTSAACTINISGGHIIASTELTEDTWLYYAYGLYISGDAGINISGSPVIDVDAQKYAYGIITGASSNTTISGGTLNVTTHGSSTAYCCHASASSTMTINGGVFNATSATSEADGARATGSASVTINGGTFNVIAGASTCYGAYTSSTEPFYITGGTFNARIGVIAGYKCEDTGSDTWTATVVINGGTFDVSNYAVYAAWDEGTEGNVVSSDITINGGHFKSTGSTIVAKENNGTGTATLTINGGYFNEKSGSTYKNQIDDFVTSPREVYAIESSDPNYEDGYRYRVTEHPVASVKTGSEITYYTTAKAALDYAKTVANPTITLLDDCSLTEANYMINPAGTWTGTLDLNNHTLTPTIQAENGRAFTIGGTGTKFIVTDNSVGQGGQIYYKGNSSRSIIYFVVAGGEMELEGGTLYVENTNAEKKAIGFVVDGNPSQFTQSGGTFSIKGAYGANGYYGKGTATFTGGTMNVDGGAYQAIGLFPYESTSKLNVSGTFALNVTSSFADSYGVLVKNSGATGTISGGKFNFNQNTMVGAQQSGNLTITGGYFVEKSGTTYKSQINSYVSSPYEIYEISSADPNYPEYSYCVTNGHPVASVQTGDEMSHYTTVLAAMNYARTVEDPTITILDDASLTARWSINPASATIPDNWHGILDLNGHTVTGAGSDYEMITVGKAGIKLTIRDSSVGQTGKITHEESTRDKVWGVNVSQGELELESGTIYVKNSKAGVDAVGICTNVNEDAVLTMKGGKVETHSAINAKALYLYGGSTTISGGKVISISELSGTLGAYAYAIFMAKNADGSAPSLTVSAADSIYAKAATTAYGLYATNTGTATIGGAPYFIAESPEGGARVLQSYGTFSVEVNGGTFEAKAGTSESYTLIPEGSSTMTVNGGKFATNQSNIVYKASDAILTINGGYFNENSGTNHKTRITSYATASGKAVIDLDTDDAEYIAGYRYLVTDDPVAKVKEGSTVTYYTTISDAWTAANSATAASTIKLLKAATVTTQLTYDNENDQNCTLDLNGFTLTSTTDVQSPLTIDNADITFTVTDGTVGKAGKLSMTTTYSSGDIYSVLINAGALVLDGGTIEVTANRQTNGIWVKTGASFTLSDGTLHVKTTNSKKGRGLYIDGGMATIDGGEIFMETAGNGTAIFYNSGTGAVTVTGGKFKIITNATEYVTFGDNKNISISGGYYNYSNDRLTKYLATSYHVFNVDPALDGIYTYEVAEGYTLAWTTDGDDLTGTYTSGTTKVGTTIVAPNTPTKTGYTFAGWSPSAPAATMPSANTTYTATWTANNYTITYKDQGDVAFSGVHADGYPTSHTYGTATTLKTATKVGYEFGGWFTTSACTGDAVTSLGATAYTANITLYAKWTEAVASVTVDEETTYYATLQAAFDYAKDKTEPTITVLDDITLAAKVTYTNTSITTVTIDLNGHTISGAASQLIYLTSGSKTEGLIVIKSSVAGGQIRNVLSSTGTRYCVYLHRGNLKLESGTIYNENTNTGSSYAIYVPESRTFTMTGGQLEAKGQTGVYGVYSLGTSNISGGKIVVTETTNGTAAGVYAADGTTTISGDVEVDVDGTSSVYGARACARPASDGSIVYSGTLNITGGTFDVYASSNTAVGVYSYAGTRPVSYGDDKVAGNYAGAGTANISGGEFTVTSAGSKAYGVFVTGTVSIATAKDAEGVTSYEEATATSTATITGGKFKVSGTSSVYAVNTSASNSDLDVRGGYYNLDNGLSDYVAPTKSCNYYCLSTTPADKASVGSDYNYKVAEAYTLKWTTDGDDLTGTYTSGLTEVGTTITAPNTPTKPGYVFNAWSPAFTGTMPSEDVTYTATWTAAVASVTVSGETTYYATMTDAWSAANSAAAASTITMLQDITVTTKLTYNNTNTQNCTLDLNGHTITSTTAEQSPLSISCSGSTFIITDNTDSKLGKLSMTTSYEAAAGVIFGAYVGAGTLQLDGGTLEVIVSSGTRNTCGVSVVSSFVMNGGTIHVNNTNGYDGRGVYCGGTVTINNGTIHVESTGNGYGLKREAGTITVNGGKFNINGATANINHTESVSGGVTIRGGWYNTNNRLNTFVPSPYHVFDLAGQSPYLYEVAAGYNLTWDLDGGAISDAGTPAGYVKVGTVVTAPTVTKTGYNFNVWSPAVVSPMPEADKTYTATWTPITYTISYDLDGGSVASENPTSYTIESSAITLNNPTKANHVFTGWTGTGLASATMTVTISAGSTGNRSYTATWTEAEASVTDGGATTYYTTVAAAVAAANATSGATVKMLKNVSTNEEEIKAAMTIDLNGKTISSTQTDNAKGVFKMNASGKTLTIRDSGTGGKIDHTVAISGGSAVGIYVAAGSLRMESGIVYAKNPSTTNGSQAFGIATASSGCGLTMTGGTVTAEAYKEARGLWLNGTTSLTDATITSTSTDYISYAVQANAGALTVHSGTYTATGTTGYALREVNGTVSIEGGKFSGSTQDFIKVDGTASISGGYYVHNTDLAANCATGYAVKALTSAEKAVIGSDYNWQVLEQYSASDKLDIVDYSATSVTLNMNGYTSAASKADWKIKAYDVTYDKTDRAADRTMEVAIPSSIQADDTIRMDGTSADDVVESRYVYIMPHIFTSDATLDPEAVRATSVLYVKSGTLTIDADARVNKVYVCADAKLKINEGVTLTVDTVVLRTKPFHAAELENNGTLTVNGQMYYSRAIANKTQYYEIALPFDVNLTNMRFSNGKAATFGSYFSLMKYDGQSRADNGANVNLNWKPLNPAVVNTMSGNNAYQMLSSSAYYYEFYFPVTYVKKDDGAEVAVTAYTKQTQGPKIAGNEGWNFITSPYTHTFEAHYADPANGIKIAWRNESDIETFTQDVATTIQPTTAFFYQTETTGSLVFSSENFIFSAPGRGGMLQTQWLRLHYGADDEPVMGDIANIFLNDDRFSTAYETGYDVVKWSTEAAHPLVWSSIGGYDLAFAALPDSVATERMIPITVYNPQGGEYVFSLEENEYLSRLSEIYLYDALENSYTDLKRDHYYCIAEEGLVTGRFFIRTVKEAEEVATGIGTGFDAADKSPRKVLIDQHIYILMPDGKMYDVSGKRCSMKE